MEHDPVEFRLDRFGDSFRVVFNPVNANIDFCEDWGAWLRQLKAEYVSIEVVFKVFLIDLQNLLVRAKYIIDGFQILSLFFEYSFNAFF